MLTEIEDDGVDEVERDFVYGNYIDEVLMMVIDDPNTYYYAHDHLYSPVALLDDEGTVVERYEYDAYGRPVIWDAALTGRKHASDYDNPYYFTGRRVDFLEEHLCLQYSRNRYYDYYTGRWLTQDDKGYVDGMNMYQYVISNPVNKIDPMGQWGFCFGNWCLGDKDDPWLVFWEGSEDGGLGPLIYMLEDYILGKGGELGVSSCISGGWDIPGPWLGPGRITISISGTICLKPCCLSNESDSYIDKGFKLCFKGGLSVCWGQSIDLTDDPTLLDEPPEINHGRKGSVGISGELEACDENEPPVDICVSLSGEAFAGGFGCNITAFQYCLGEGWEGDNFLSGGDCSFSGFELEAGFQICGNAEVEFCMFLGLLGAH